MKSIIRYFFKPKFNLFDLFVSGMIYAFVSNMHQKLMNYIIVMAILTLMVIISGLMEGIVEDYEE